MHAQAITPITEIDLAWWHEKITELDWVFAVRYAEGAPHEYVTDKTSGLSEGDLTRAARVIHTFGEPQKFYKQTRIYLEHDGWKYWTMDHHHSDVTLINRGRSHHIYGVQNAHRTASATHTPYDPIATYWDEHFALSSAEGDGFTRVVERVTGGYRKFRTLDVGSGTGATLDLGLAEAIRLTAIDPSHAMLNELVRKHPFTARVEPYILGDVQRLRLLGGTIFDIVLALGGSASYLSPEDWQSLPSLGKGRVVLSVYPANEAPPTKDLSEQALSAARQHAREFAALTRGRIERIGRFDVVVTEAESPGQAS